MRDYDTSIGRYVEADPRGFGGGYNLYAYAGQNPMQFIDSSGLNYYKSWLDPLNPTNGWQLVSWAGTYYPAGLNMINAHATSEGQLADAYDKYNIIDPSVAVQDMLATTGNSDPSDSYDPSLDTLVLGCNTAMNGAARSVAHALHRSVLGTIGTITYPGDFNSPAYGEPPVSPVNGSPGQYQPATIVRVYPEPVGPSAPPRNGGYGPPAPPTVQGY
jgi:hypothetical protein